MKNTITIPPELAILIPCAQLEMTKRRPDLFSDSLDRLAAALKICPAIGETEGKKEHPCMFHYSCFATDIFICEYDRKDLMFGYTILNDDLQNAEWGYTSLKEIINIRQFNIDYYFPEQTIEAALYWAYPDHYKKPKSIVRKSWKQWLDEGIEAKSLVLSVPPMSAQQWHEKCKSEGLTPILENHILDFVRLYKRMK